MSDFRLKPALTIVAGVSGSGKSTFTLRLLRSAEDAVCRFVFDFKTDKQTGHGEFATRLGLPNQYTAKELEAALATGWVLFNPRLMFPPDAVDENGDAIGSDEQLSRAFLFFTAWVYEASTRGPGRKLYAIDESWMYCSPHKIPPELATCVQAGRMEGLELIFQTQRPHKLNESIIGQCTELVVFKLRSRLSIEALMKEHDDLTRDIARNLQDGQFWALNTNTGHVIEGSVF